MTAQRVLFLFLLLTAVLFAQGTDQQRPSRRLRKQAVMTASMFSIFTSFKRRLAALEAKSEDNAALEAKIEEEVQKRLGDLQAKTENTTQQRMAALEAGMQRLEEMVSDLLNTRMKATEHRLTEVEAKTNSSEERLATLEADKADSQSSAAVCRYQYQYQFEREAPRSSGDHQRLAKLETELSRMQERVSALDQRPQDSHHSLGDLHNQSLLAVQGMVHTVTELVAASEDSVTSNLKNATEFLQESAAALMKATTARVEQATRELTSRVSAVEERVLSRLDNATSLTLDKVRTEMESSNARCGEDVKRRIDALENATKEMCRPDKRTCQEYYDGGRTESGVYMLDLKDGQPPIEVFCDMTDGTAWAVFQRRKDGSVNFYNNWTMYEEGFGDLLGEFWLGNKNLHRLTRAGLTQLKVDLEAWHGNTAHASYSHFSVGDASSSYTLSVSGYSGTAGNSLASNNGQKFSTKDKDNDSYSRGHCAQIRKGAWWYWDCSYSNLNALYGSRSDSGKKYVLWYDWYSDWRALKSSAMKLK